MNLKCLYRLVVNSVTTADNSSFDVVRIGMVVSGCSMIGLSIVAVVVNKQDFDPLIFGGGAAAIFAGGGFGIAQKRREEAGAMGSEGPPDTAL